MTLCVAQRLLQIRREKGLSQEDIARLIGVRLRTVQRWEKKSFKPSRLAEEKIRKFLEAL